MHRYRAFLLNGAHTRVVAFACKLQKPFMWRWAVSRYHAFGEPEDHLHISAKPDCPSKMSWHPLELSVKPRYHQISNVTAKEQ